MSRRSALLLFVAACDFGLDPSPQPLVPFDAGEADAGDVVDAGPPPDRVVLTGLLPALIERFECEGRPCGTYRLTFDVENRGLTDVESLTSLQFALNDIRLRPGNTVCRDLPWLVPAGQSAAVALELEYLTPTELRLTWPCGGEQTVEFEAADLPPATESGLFTVRATGRFVNDAPWGSEATSHIADLTDREAPEE